MKNQNFKIFLFLLISFQFSLVYTSSFCGTNDLKVKPLKKLVKKNIKKVKGRSLAGKEPIRIFMDYSNLPSSISFYNNLKSVFDRCVKFFESILKVDRLEYLNLGETVSDVSDFQEACQVEKYDQRLFQKNQLNYDIAIFPSMYEEFRGSSTQAAATFCINDDLDNRPLAGFVYINPELKFNDKNSETFLFNLLIHEMSHVFVFHPSLWGVFEGNAVQETTIMGIKRYIFTSPKVVQQARKHFGCSSLKGVELESQGGEGSAGAHWESRIMLGDYMVSTDYPDIVLSDISLAMFEDSGWYEVNYYSGGLFRYGKGEGCNFLEERCIQYDDTPFPNDFCLNSFGPLCSSGHLSYGMCYLGIFQTSIPKEYRYFSIENDNDPEHLGGLEVADFCPVFYSTDSEYLSGNCKYGNAEYSEYPGLGEKLGDNSLCFVSSLVPKDDPSVTKFSYSKRAICYETSCDFTNKNVIVKINGKEIKCPKNGGEKSADGFDGTIQCPDFNVVCTSRNFCNNIEDCVNKKAVSESSSFSYDYSITKTIYADSSLKYPEGFIPGSGRDGLYTNNNNGRGIRNNGTFIKNRKIIIQIIGMILFILI